jgi:hypothetical protein
MAILVPKPLGNPFCKFRGKGPNRNAYHQKQIRLRS